MKNILPILATAWLGASTWVLAQAPGPPARSAGSAASTTAVSVSAAQIPQEKVARAESLMRQSVDALDRFNSIAAKLRYQVDIFDQPVLIGTGMYYQGSSASHRLRLELKLQVGDRVTSLQQVADGNYLWIQNFVNASPTLGRVDIQQFVAAQQAALTTAAGAVPPSSLPGLGGLPRLMRSLDRSFRFTDCMQTKLAGTPVYALRGSWKPTALALMLPEQQLAIEAGQKADFSKVAASVPEHVIVFIGQKDLFPYRIEYRRSQTSWLSRLKGDAMPAKVLLKLELFEVRLNVPLEPMLFVYQPGDALVVDQTAEYLK
jgi:hypothetical protein